MAMLDRGDNQGPRGDVASLSVLRDSFQDLKGKLPPGEPIVLGSKVGRVRYYELGEAIRKGESGYRQAIGEQFEFALVLEFGSRIGKENKRKDFDKIVVGDISGDSPGSQGWDFRADNQNMVLIASWTKRDDRSLTWRLLAQG